MPPRRFESLRSIAEHRAVNRRLSGLVRDAGATRFRIVLYEGAMPAWYLGSRDLWLAAHALPNRYRNAFGPGFPGAGGSASPSVQLNLPLAPGSSRPSARFLRDGRGGYVIAHSGRLGGRVHGISRDGFVAFLGGERAMTDVVVDGRPERVHLLGSFARPTALLDAITRLVHAAHAYRSAIAAGLE